VDSLLLGLSFGLAAGISPGPLLALIITSTLKFGRRAGLLAAAAPLISDAVVVAVALPTLNQLSPTVLAVLGVGGGLFVAWSGWSTIRDARSAGLGPMASSAPPGTTLVVVRQAVLVNLVSPHPWLFWVTAFGPLVIATGRQAPGGAVALVAGFYLTLVGAHMAVALLIAGSRGRLTDTGYRRALIGSGALLLLAGLALTVEFLPQVGP
jgi:threonine/homoserine/homoserine lactone efflux protein